MPRSLYSKKGFFILTRRYYAGGDPAQALSIEELRRMARRRLPAFVFEYLEGGAEDEVTLRRNREVFDQLAFVPRTLQRVCVVDTSVQLLGGRSALPLAIAPTGFNGLMARDGDAALARAAAAAGVPFIQSTVSNATLETVSKVAGLRHWMQLYVFRSREFMERLVGRALEAGCEALVLTSDGSVFGNREWDKRSYRGDMRLTWRKKLEVLGHPHWMAQVLARGIPTFGNLAELLPPEQRRLAAAAKWSREEIDADLDWDRLTWLRALWPRKLLLKGVLDVEDAGRALQAGVDGVVLTNHGGRQLDGAIAPLTALPAIAGRYRDQMDIFVDSGYRRGSDVVKALALGAHGVLLGRATLYGLGAAGEAGAARALAIMAGEIRRAMALLGRPAIGQLDRSCLLGEPVLPASARGG
ncbi:MAG TPA: alpha-hydroxy acid oxidase [Bordetella sp.]